MPTLKKMAECAWQTTCAYLENCESPAEVALTFEIALRAIVEYQTLQGEVELEDNPKEVELADLDDCPGWQHLIENEEE